MKSPLFLQGGLASALHKKIAARKPSSVFIFADRRALPSTGLTADATWLPSETKKTAAQVEALQRKMVRAGMDRQSLLIAVGGGLTTDIGGFAAATFQRGIPWISVPTTLLGMADAAIGGKTAINLPEGKNLVGAFHFPVATLADIRTLRTLPEREWSSGLGEVLKSGMLGATDVLKTLATTPKSSLRRSGKIAFSLAQQSARYKCKVVRQDPTEQGDRKLLNLGHTFGHALETAAGPKKLRHGEAVGLGILCALRCSVEHGLADPAWAQEIRRILQRLGLPTQFPGVFPSNTRLKSLLLRDKKTRQGRLNLILPIKPGLCLQVEGVQAKEVIGILADEVK